MTPYTVRIGDIEIGDETPVRIMGVINLSSESFYSGSIATSGEDLQEIVRQMEKDGADIIDVGGASSAPKSIYRTSDVSVEEELQRVREGMNAIMDVARVPVSIDTTSSVVAEAALDLGAGFVNDISGLRKDPKMVGLVASRDVPIVLMALCREPCSEISESVTAVRQSLEIAEDAGISRDRIIVDPGIGFGKPAEVDYAILRNLRRFTMWGHPVLVGVSRKAFIGELLEQADPQDRLIGSVATTSLAVSRGAKIIRSHDVTEARMAATVGEALGDFNQRGLYGGDLFGALNEKEAEIVIENIGTGADIRRALARKAVTLSLLLKSVKTPTALILKQELLALGGDVAYHTDVIDSKIDKTDVLVMGTPLQLQKLSGKILRMDYFGLPRIGEMIQELLENRENRLR